MLFRLGNLIRSSISLQRRETKAFKWLPQRAGGEGLQGWGHQELKGGDGEDGARMGKMGEDGTGMEQGWGETGMDGAGMGWDGRGRGAGRWARVLCPPTTSCLSAIVHGPRGQAALPLPTTFPPHLLPFCEPPQHPRDEGAILWSPGEAEGVEKAVSFPWCLL